MAKKSKEDRERERELIRIQKELAKRERILRAREEAVFAREFARAERVIPALDQALFEDIERRERAMMEREEAVLAQELEKQEHEEWEQEQDISGWRFDANYTQSVLNIHNNSAAEGGNQQEPKDSKNSNDLSGPGNDNDSDSAGASSIDDGATKRPKVVLVSDEPAGKTTLVDMLHGLTRNKKYHPTTKWSKTVIDADKGQYDLWDSSSNILTQSADIITKLLVATDLLLICIDAEKLYHLTHPDAEEVVESGRYRGKSFPDVDERILFASWFMLLARIAPQAKIHILVTRKDLVSKEQWQNLLRLLEARKVVNDRPNFSFSVVSADDKKGVKDFFLRQTSNMFMDKSGMALADTVNTADGNVDFDRSALGQGIEYNIDQREMFGANRFGRFFAIPSDFMSNSTVDSDEDMALYLQYLDYAHTELGIPDDEELVIDQAVMNGVLTEFTEWKRQVRRQQLKEAAKFDQDYWQKSQEQFKRCPAPKDFVSGSPTSKDKGKARESEDDDDSYDSSESSDAELVKQDVAAVVAQDVCYSLSRDRLPELLWSEGDDGLLLAENSDDTGDAGEDEESWPTIAFISAKPAGKSTLIQRACSSERVYYRPRSNGLSQYRPNYAVNEHRYQHASDAYHVLDYPNGQLLKQSDVDILVICASVERFALIKNNIHHIDALIRQHFIDVLLAQPLNQESTKVLFLLTAADKVKASFFAAIFKRLQQAAGLYNCFASWYSVKPGFTFDGESAYFKSNVISAIDSERLYQYASDANHNLPRLTFVSAVPAGKTMLLATYLQQQYVSFPRKTVLFDESVVEIGETSSRQQVICVDVMSTLKQSEKIAYLNKTQQIVVCMGLQYIKPSNGDKLTLGEVGEATAQLLTAIKENYPDVPVLLLLTQFDLNFNGEDKAAIMRLSRQLALRYRADMQISSAQDLESVNRLFNAVLPARLDMAAAPDGPRP